MRFYGKIKKKGVNGVNFTVYQDKPYSSEQTAVPRARFYLLNSALCIIEERTQNENGEDGAHGTSFFDLFPAKRVVQEEIAAYVRSYPQQMLLSLCSRTPVLFIGTLTAHTGLVLAAVPEGEVRSTLSFPAAFHRVPACVSVSPSAQMRYKMHGEAAFAAAAQWLLGISAPFICPKDAALVPTLSFCAQRLSRLLNVPFPCDFSGLSALSCAGLDMELAISVMLAALMAARRESAEEGVRLYAAMEGAPTLYLEYVRAKCLAEVPEFLPLLVCAAARGAILDVVCPKQDPHRVQIRAAFGVVELSAQGIRERHRFLEGKSPLCALLQSRAISQHFPEFPLN